MVAPSVLIWLIYEEFRNSHGGAPSAGVGTLIFAVPIAMGGIPIAMGAIGIAMRFNATQ